MKSLALYIDKWYIVGAVTIDGNTRPVNLPNREDRIWLYFHEDTANDEISYGKGFQKKFRNNELHYYGDVFSSITNSSATFSQFGHKQPLRTIFKTANIFADLRNDVEEDGEIETYLSFSKDISLAARKLFVDELQAEGFVIKESVARIGHLALEYAAVKCSLYEDGYYLLLNACNENLHYSIYQKSEDIFVRISEDVLEGRGTDVRCRALVEHVVTNINTREHFLKTDKEMESEYLRMAQYVDEWIVKLSNARGAMPVQLTNVTFSKDPYKDYSVSLKRSVIDQRTESIVRSIVNEVAKFVKDSDIRHEQITGIVLLGDTFTNQQFKTEICNHYNLPNNKIIHFRDSDVSSLVSAYSFINCEQFSATTTKLRANAEVELKRIKQAEEELAEAKKAEEAAQAQAQMQREATETERKFKDAMEKGYDAEREHDYDDMVDYFKIARDLRPDDEEAERMYNEALRKKAENEVALKTYKEKIQQAKSAFDNKDWDVAKQKADEALTHMPESKEALRIKEESSRHIKQEKELERYLDRADLFIAQKAYNEAAQELEKAKLLDVDNKEITERERRIYKEQSVANAQIEELTKRLNDAIDAKKYDDALNYCNQLIEVDFTNSRRWSVRIGEIRTKQEQAKESERRLKKLIDEIDTALLKNDWIRLSSLCNEYLDIQDSDAVRAKLNKAYAIIEEQKKEKELDDTISEIQSLILQNEFEEADAKLRLLRNQKLNTIRDSQVKELYKLKFKQEGFVQASQKPNTTESPEEGSPKPAVVTGFAPAQPKKESPKKEKQKEDFDFFEMEKPKNNPSSRPKQQPSKQVKKEQPKNTGFDFFDSSKGNAGNATMKINNNNKGHLTNDDFNF